MARAGPGRPGSPEKHHFSCTVQPVHRVGPPRGYAPGPLGWANPAVQQEQPAGRVSPERWSGPLPGWPGSARAGPGRPGHLKNIPFHAPFSRHTELGHAAGIPHLPWAGANVLCNRSGQRGGVAENGCRVEVSAGPGRPGPARVDPGRPGSARPTRVCPRSAGTPSWATPRVSPHSPGLGQTCCATGAASGAGWPRTVLLGLGGRHQQRSCVPFLLSP